MTQPATRKVTERRIRLRPLAERDIAAIVTRIAHDDPAAAARLVDALQREFEALRAFPRLGRARAFRSPQLAGIPSRPVSGFRSWLLFYRVLPDAIDVVRVLHGARDLPTALDERRP